MQRKKFNLRILGSALVLVLLVLIPFIKTSKGAANTSSKLKGRILLQVEDAGQAWYVLPDQQKRVYLGRPADAFRIMREYGLGISNKDFDRHKKRRISNLTGKILIKVEDLGKAYYTDPKQKKVYYMGTPADAFILMRKLGLGISNDDLASIEIYENDPSSLTEEIDSDTDGISDDDEVLLDTDPLSSDSDSDGYSDYEEISSGYNPLGDGNLPDTYDVDLINKIKAKFLARGIKSDDQENEFASAIADKTLRKSFSSFPAFDSQTFTISNKEQKLADYINDYRESKGLSRIPVSKKLSYVAKMHVMDLLKNRPQSERGCNPHSWSEQANWSKCCYGHGKSSDCIASKGSEIINYPGKTFENLYLVNKNFYVTPEAAIRGWKKSPGHNILMINKGWAKDFDWKALGVAFYANYAVMWVGDQPDADIITKPGDCGKITDSFIKNECYYDNASLDNNISECSLTGSDAYNQDCNLRASLYQCSGLAGKGTQKDCLKSNIAENKRACDYFYNSSKKLSKCYYYHDYVNKDKKIKLSLRKGVNQIAFSKNIAETAGELLDSSDNIESIAVYIGAERKILFKDQSQTSSLDRTWVLLPFSGVEIKTIAPAKVYVTRKPEFIYQDLADQLPLGSKAFVGFQNLKLNFSKQLMDICPNFKVQVNNSENKLINIKPGKKPIRRRAYWVECSQKTIIENPTDQPTGDGNGNTEILPTTLSFKKGWNYVSFPGETLKTVENFVAENDITSVRQEDRTYSPKLPPFFNNLPYSNPFKPYTGYWINASSSFAATVGYSNNTDSQDLSSQLVDGWNSIGFQDTNTKFSLKLEPFCRNFKVKGQSSQDTSDNSTVTYIDTSVLPDSYPDGIPEVFKGYDVYCQK